MLKVQKNYGTLSKVCTSILHISMIFEVNKELSNLQQGEKEFKDVFGHFRGLLAELEMLRRPTYDVGELNERSEQYQVVCFSS
ncbi:hypothetical protein Bca4012_098566 [Brassica carinata]